MASPKLEVRIGAELAELRKGLADAQRAIQQFGQRAEQSTTRASRSMDGLRGSVEGIRGEIGAMVAGFATLGTVVALARVADDATRLRGQLDLATKSQEDFALAQRATFEVAQRTRSSLESTVALFSRISRATDQTELTTRQVLGLTEVIAQAGQLSQTSASSIEAAFFQLSQGLASGQLRGEELNSVLEGAPRLARAIQDGFKELGVEGSDDLRKLAESGQLTTENVLAALATQQEKLREEFEKLPITISGSIQQLKNSFTLLIGETDRAAGSSSSLAQNISTLATFLGNYAKAQQGAASATQKTGREGQFLVSVVRVLGSVFQGVVFVFKVVGTAIGGLFALFSRLREQATLTAEVVGDYFSTLGQSASLALRGQFGAAQAVQEAFYARSRARVEGFTAGNAALLDSFISDISAAAEEGGAAINALWNTSTEQGAAEDLKLDAEEVADALDKGGNAAKGLTDALNQGALAIDANKRALDALEEDYRANAISIEAYFQRRLELQREGLRLEAAQAEAEARKATTQEARTNALTRVAQIERELGALGTKAAREQEAAVRALDGEVAKLEQRLATLRGNQSPAAAGAAAAAEAARGLEELRARLTANGRDTSVVDAIISEEAVRARLARVEELVGESTSRLRQTEDNINLNLSGGNIGQVEAEEQIQSAREGTIAQLQEMRAELAAYYNTAEGRTPAVAAAMRTLDTEIARVRATQRSWTQDLRDAATQGLEQFFVDIATGAKSLKDAVLDLARNFVKAVAQMVAQKLALQAVNSIFGAFGLNTATPTVQHTGGMAGTGPRRKVSPLLFAGAPRYHSGGIAGLKPGEVPAILQTGEEVLSRQDPRNMMNGGRGQGTGVRIVNVVDPSMAADYLESSAGERTVMNVLSRNAGAVRQILQG